MHKNPVRHNMLYLKSLRLKNFCSYADHTFDFTRPDGTPYNYVCFYGPNGIGKSTLLEAITLLFMSTKGRSMSFVCQSLQKFVRNKDYDPTWNRVESTEALTDMFIEGIYLLDGKEYIVQVTQKGCIRNDLIPVPSQGTEPEEAAEVRASGPWGKKHMRHRERICYFVKTDSDLSLNKFQLHISQVDNFEKIMNQIMRYKADCVSPSGLSMDERNYCTDFVIHKKDHQIHFKRMSAGEKKIAKSFSVLFNMMRDLSDPGPGHDAMPGWPRLLLMDNVVMHVYFDRHVAMIDSLKGVFQEQQIFATTHSGILVQRHLEGKTPEDELMIDLEPIND